MRLENRVHSRTLRPAPWLPPGLSPRRVGSRVEVITEEEFDPPHDTTCSRNLVSLGDPSAENESAKNYRKNALNITTLFGNDPYFD